MWGREPGTRHRILAAAGCPRGPLLAASSHPITASQEGPWNEGRGHVADARGSRARPPPVGLCAPPATASDGARTARARRTPEPRPAGSVRGAQRSLEPGRRCTREGQLEPGGLGGLRRSPGSQGMCSREIRVQGRLGVGAWWLRESGLAGWEPREGVSRGGQAGRAELSEGVPPGPFPRRTLGSGTPSFSPGRDVPLVWKSTGC